ncbi:MAG: hypothetical protein HFI85_05535 [Clostridia bacterium]|jgi:hypothetical protein|nr:hypothetical protein [Clostridia bacterium]
MNKDNENKGTVKSSKPRSLWNRIGKKVTASAVGFGLILGAAFGFAGCTDQNKPGPTPPGPGPGPIDPNPPIIVEDNIKMSNFLTENAAIADIFIGNLVRPEAISAIDDDIKSEKCTLVASEDQECLQQVNFVYTLKTGETTRAVKLATVTMDEDLTFSKIVEHYTSQSKLANDEFDVIKNVNTQTIFEFDAKENHDRQDVADAVYAVLETSSDIKLFNQSESPTAGYERMTYLENIDNNYTVHQFDVRNSSTDEGLIKNLSRPNNLRDYKEVSKTSVDGTVYYNNAYELEDIKDGSEVDPPVVETITKQQIIDALDANCKENLVKNNLSFADNMANVKDGKWYITTNADGKITGAEYAYNYQRSTNGVSHVIGKVEFETPVNAKDFVEGKISNATYSRNYRFDYDASIQAARQELTDAMCEKVFETNGTVIGRYIVDNGGSSSDPILSGTIRRFTVIEVTDKGVQEAKVNIKTSSTDAEYISKLNNENDYRVYDKVEEKISGEEVKDIEVETPATTKTVSKAMASPARYAVTWGDDEIMYL